MHKWAPVSVQIPLDMSEKDCETILVYIPRMGSHATDRLHLGRIVELTR